MYFDYQPVAAKSLTPDYAMLYPEHQRWLVKHAVHYVVSNYIWPELLSRLAHGEIGVETCVFRLTIPDEADAKAFSYFSGMNPND